MAAFRIRRKSTTPKGFLRRTLDAGFERVDDPRHQAWVVHRLDAMLRLGMVSLARETRSPRWWPASIRSPLVVGLLRAMAIDVLAVLRALSRDEKGEAPSWQSAIEQALMVLCEPILDMDDFNAVDR